MRCDNPNKIKYREYYLAQLAAIKFEMLKGYKLYAYPCHNHFHLRTKKKSNRRPRKTFS